MAFQLATSSTLASMKKLSPLRTSTDANNLNALVDEQLAHFGIDPKDDYGGTLKRIITHLYQTQPDIDKIWQQTIQCIPPLTQIDKIQRFNSLKFISFQLAKLLDTLQNPNRTYYQNLNYSSSTQTSKGPYPVFDNVTAIFSATPVITRTATYIYACTEWIADAFCGKELLLEIYSRMLNPTSICLANHIVDLETGPYASDYLAWNFDSGMAAIDAILSHALGRDDIMIMSRNVYGGAYQLIHSWYAKKGNLEIMVEIFDGYSLEEYEKCFKKIKQKYLNRLKKGRKVYTYLESPCNPHGYVMNVADICKYAHENDGIVILDNTVGTPFLSKPLQRENEKERPDFVIHSYTKDLSGCGGTIAGCVIGKNEHMFLPKGEQFNGCSWEQTMFWNIYFVKGAFLNADAAFEVMQGIKTLSMRMLAKCINTIILAKFLNSHPSIIVHCNVLDDNSNAEYRKKYMYLQLPAPLFTIDMGHIPRRAFKRFFDSLSPTFGHMISLGQSNTIVSCPSLTTHSELNDDELYAAGMSPTTIRFAVGDENPSDLIKHLVYVARGTIDPEVPKFSNGFMNESKIKELIRTIYTQCHQAYMDSQLKEGEQPWY